MSTRGRKKATKVEEDVVDKVDAKEEKKKEEKKTRYAATYFPLHLNSTMGCYATTKAVGFLASVFIP